MATTQKPAQRNHNFSDGALLQKADELKMFRARDAADFAGRGITDTDAMEEAHEVLDLLPTDEALAGVVTEKSDLKDAARGTLELHVSELRTAATLAHKGNAGAYKRYGFEGFSDLEDDNVSRAARNMAIVAELQMDALELKGYDTDKLTALKLAIQTFDDRMDEVVLAKATRDIETAKRVSASNNLYSHVSDIALVGRDIYRATNEAKYNDYVLNPAGNGNNQPDPDPGGGGGTDQ